MLAAQASFFAAAICSGLYDGDAAVTVVVTGAGVGFASPMTLMTTAATPSTAAAVVALYEQLARADEAAVEMVGTPGVRRRRGFGRRGLWR